MRHKKAKNLIGKNSSHNISLRRNLAASLVINGNITTTENRAKIVRPYIEKLITIANQNDLTAKRRLDSLLNHKQAEVLLLKEVAKKYKDGKGGYVRIYKMGTRKGDNAKMVRVELV